MGIQVNIQMVSDGISDKVVTCPNFCPTFTTRNFFFVVVG